MSYDLHIFAKRQPRYADLTEVLERNDRSVRADGVFKRGGSMIFRDNRGITAEVDGPNRVDTDDVPDAAYGAIGTSGWLVEISVKPPTDVGWPRDLATHLARVADGVVYDPQEDVVVWPEGWRPRDRITGDEAVDLVELTWFFSRPTEVEAIPRRILGIMAERCPESLPRRFGVFEPLQDRFEGDQRVDRFVGVWRTAAEEWVSSLFWTADRPCFGGDVFISSLRKYPPGSPQATVKLSLSFDGRPFFRDPAFTERIVEFFQGVASVRGSIYAAACLVRGHTLSRGRLSGTATSETGPFPRADAWIGLPASPTWLAWFGRSYAAAVGPAVAAHIASETETGILIRMGAVPLNADALAASFPPLPGRLVTRRRDQPGVWLPGLTYSLVSGPPSQPAEDIPSLTDDT